MAVALFQPKPMTQELPLLLEPDQPVHHKTQGSGWLRQGDVLVRNHRDDAHGALIQHVIVRYLVHGVQRQTLAQEILYSDRQIQSWISGRSKWSYAEPVRRSLQSLGIGMGRGGVSEQTSGKRASEVVQACMALISEMQTFMPLVWPHARELRQTARLLTAGREPLGPVS